MEGKGKIMRAEHPETSGRQVGDKGKIMRHPEPTLRRKTSPETNVKSCGPGMHPFQKSKNPSQVNLFGEKRNIIARPCFAIKQHFFSEFLFVFCFLLFEGLVKVFHMHPSLQVAKQDCC